MSVNSSEGTRFGLSGNALKLIVIIAMTVDHLAWMGIETYSQAETPYSGIFTLRLLPGTPYIPQKTL